MGVVEGCQELCTKKKKSCGEEKEGKNKRVADSFILQHPILDYISGSCFLCVVLWPGPKKEKKKLLKFHLICCRNSSVCQPLQQGSLKAPRSQISEGKITLIISLSRWPLRADILCNQRGLACAAGAWETGPLPGSRGRALMAVKGRQTT